MIVDDSAVLSKMARMNLEKAGFQVVTASDGQEAMDKVAQENPDIILLDAEMPVMDGWETCEALKKNEATKNIPVMMCTGDNSPEYLEKAKTLGAAGYLTKPYNFQDMIAKVTEALASKK
jgi:CheY-like chemotaxis protein